MDTLLAEKDALNIPAIGDVVRGTVLSVSKNEVLLNIDGLTTGIIRGRELYDESGEYSQLKIGEEAQATVLEIENETGSMELSFRHAGHKKAWDQLQELFRDKQMVEALITDANRGGLMVKVGRVVGFLPVSQLTTEHYPRVEGGDKNKILEILQKFIGSKFKVKIIDLDEADDKLIVSEKAANEEELKARIATFKVGDVIEGKATGVVDFGVFVEFGDKLEGLVHISELAWQRIDNPRELASVGDAVQAKIIQIDGTKISLSVKQLKDDPWKQAVERYSVGQMVKGKVIKLNSFGAFVELDKDIHGLAHISELSEQMVREPGEVVKLDETYKFRILSIDAKGHRLGLSLKALKKPAQGGSAMGGREEEAPPTTADAPVAPTDAQPVEEEKAPKT